MRGRYRRLNWRQLVLLAGVTTATGAAVASDCVDPSTALQVAQVGNTSDWREFDGQGRGLVHESGMLQGTALSAELRCSAWIFQLGFAQSDGRRSYDGQTSSGVLATSQSALRQSTGQLQTSRKLGDAWRVGARVSGRTIWRDIASVGAASGYPERFDWALFSLGSQWSTPVGPGQLSLAAWLGTQLSAGMVLNLPGRDQATLKLGAIRQSELAMEWQLPLGERWTFQADVRYTSTDIGQGADAVITRNGVPVGIAHQPRTSLVDMPLAIQLGYRF